MIANNRELERELQRAELAALEELSRGDARAPYSASELIQFLRTKGFRDEISRSAVWHLMDLGTVDVAGDWTVTLSPTAEAS